MFATGAALELINLGLRKRYLFDELLFQNPCCCSETPNVRTTTKIEFYPANSTPECACALYAKADTSECVDVVFFDDQDMPATFTRIKEWLARRGQTPVNPPSLLFVVTNIDPRLKKLDCLWKHHDARWMTFVEVSHFLHSRDEPIAITVDEREEKEEGKNKKEEDSWRRVWS